METQVDLSSWMLELLERDQGGSYAWTCRWVLKAMDFDSATCRQKTEEGQGESPGVLQHHNSPAEVGAAKGNPKSVERESRSMITSKTRKGKIRNNVDYLG